MAECLVRRIGKGLKDAVITPSSSSATVYGGDGSKTISFTYTGNGTVSASSSNTGVATVSVSGNNITITYIAAGNATITISAPKTSKYKECSATVAVTCSRSDPTMSVSASSGTIYGGGSDGAYTYSYNGDGTVSASSSATDVATVTLSGTNIAVKYVKPGSATITISAPQTVKYNAVSATIAITCSRTALTKPSLTQTSFSTTGNWCAPGYYNYDGNLMTVSGTTGTSSPGSYAIYFNLKDTNRYCWSDGSTGQVGCGWSVSAGTIAFYLAYNSYLRPQYYVVYYCTYGSRFYDLHGLRGTGVRPNQSRGGVYPIISRNGDGSASDPYVGDTGYSNKEPWVSLHYNDGYSNRVGVWDTVNNGQTYYAKLGNCYII